MAGLLICVILLAAATLIRVILTALTPSSAPITKANNTLITRREERTKAQTRLSISGSFYWETESVKVTMWVMDPMGNLAAIVASQGRSHTYTYVGSNTWHSADGGDSSPATVALLQGVKQAWEERASA